MLPPLKITLPYRSPPWKWVEKINAWAFNRGYTSSELVHVKAPCVNFTCLFSDLSYMGIILGVFWNCETFWPEHNVTCAARYHLHITTDGWERHDKLHFEKNLAMFLSVEATWQPHVLFSMVPLKTNTEPSIVAYVHVSVVLWLVSFLN